MSQSYTDLEMKSRRHGNFGLCQERKSYQGRSHTTSGPYPRAKMSEGVEVI